MMAGGLACCNSAAISSASGPGGDRVFYNGEIRMMVLTSSCLPPQGQSAELQSPYCSHPVAQHLKRILGIGVVFLTCEHLWDKNSLRTGTRKTDLVDERGIL